MAKKAPSKVAKKSALKKTKTKKEKVAKHRTGRKWFYPETPMFPDGSLLAKVVEQFEKAEGRILGENDLIASLEKAGLKADGNKTPKKMVKSVLRNMSRSGLIIKDRDRRKQEKEAKAANKKSSKSKKDEAEDDDEEEVTETAAEKKEPAKKNVIKKKPAAAKTAAKKK